MKVLKFPVGIQMVTSSRALNEIGVDSTSVQFTPHLFGYRPDLCLDVGSLPTLQAKEKIKQFLTNAAKEYDIFHYHDLPASLYYLNPIDLQVFKESGKPMVIQHEGSEVRRLSIARSFGNPYVKVRNYWSNEQKITERLNKWSKLFDHAIVADYELYHYIKNVYKNIHIIRQAINLTEFPTCYPSPENSTPLIVHAPSDKTLKGTDYLIDAVKQLEEEGIDFKFQLIEKMPYTRAKEIYQKADIIVDQLCIGSFGNFSLEGMAMGKPVICYIRDDLWATYPPGLPIVNANPNTIYSQLKNLILDGEQRRKIGIQGRQYVEKYHNATDIACQLKELYQKIL